MTEEFARGSGNRKEKDVSSLLSLYMHAWQYPTFGVNVDLEEYAKKLFLQNDVFDDAEFERLEAYQIETGADFTEEDYIMDPYVAVEDHTAFFLLLYMYEEDIIDAHVLKRLLGGLTFRTGLHGSYIDYLKQRFDIFINEEGGE